MDHNEFLEDIKRVGWFPSNLCPEARDALVLPPLPRSLSTDDKLGLLWFCTFDTYRRRFFRGFRGLHTAEEERGGILVLVSVVYLLRKLGAQKHIGSQVVDPTLEDIVKWANQMVRWLFETLHPSWDKLLDAQADAIADSPEQFEPARTWSLIRRKQHSDDHEQGMLALARGIAMHEQGKLIPSTIRSIGATGASRSDPERMSSDEGEAYLAFLSSFSDIMQYDHKGNLTADSLSIKTVLDQIIGRKPRRQIHSQTSLSAEIETRQDPADNLIASEVQEALERDLAALPGEVRDLLEEVLAVHHAEEVLDALHEAALAKDLPGRAAILYRGWKEQVSRERLAQVFRTTVDRIRTAEKILR